MPRDYDDVGFGQAWVGEEGKAVRVLFGRRNRHEFNVASTRVAGTRGAILPGMVEIIVEATELMALSSQGKRAIVQPLDPRYSAGEVVALRVHDPTTKKVTATLFANITYVERLEKHGLCVLSLDPRLTTGTPGSRPDLEGD